MDFTEAIKTHRNPGEALSKLFELSPINQFKGYRELPLEVPSHKTTIYGTVAEGCCSSSPPARTGRGVSCAAAWTRLRIIPPRSSS
jgi:hypothetical protein